MALAYNDFNQNSLCSLPPDNILNLVNERLLEPTGQQRTSELKNYFLGYKECLETPPSPAPSDREQLFSYLEQSITNFDEVRPTSPSHGVLLRNPPAAECQGRDNSSSKPHKANCFYNQSTMAGRKSQNYIPHTCRNAEEEIREWNGKEDEDVQEATAEL